MSLKRLAVISAVGSHNSFNNQTISYISSYSGASGTSVEQNIIVGHAGSGTVRTTGGHHQGLQTMRPGANLHGNVNIMLGGAMLSVVITVVCFVCYCCHRNIKKRSNSIYRQQWLETEANMEIYSVEQCYDPPPSGTGGFFMDGSSTTGDYQSLPMVTNAINHTNHHPQYPYHHQHYHQQQQQQQQQHHYQYTPYPNGPPPSYDTVVAQDELLASVSRRKRTYTTASDTRRSTAGPSSHSCSDLESPDCDKQSGCPESITPLLPKTSTRSQRRCGVSASNERTYSDDPADEPLCRSVQQPYGWYDTHRDGTVETYDGETSCSCPTMANGSSISRTGDGGTIGQAVPPIYCRNCGYFVEGSRESPTSPVRLPNTLPSTHRPRTDSIELTRNETLLVDYETISAETTPARSSDGHDDVNRNNTIDDTATSADIDMLTMQMMASALPTAGPTVPLDTMNNNIPNTANETKNLRYSIGVVAPDSSSSSTSLNGEDGPGRTVTSSPNANSENNNIITDSSTAISATDHRETPATTGDIIHQCPNTSSNQCGSQTDSYLQPAGGEDPTPSVEDHTNGNDNLAVATTRNGCAETEPSGIRSLLNENGLVRLDMSQIIDNTGLPTYEAALKLESSGYV
ncbi:uncharacterized protein LOC128301192 [Anopheles moucheti]|uniref:uncharacterized protein LOC128301192 n=1 Tax=Anopheles moucheti TaxID=186751 RepID=UPI0022EFF2B6|nr:uncharacterized protein LOC128301192 [Anopheles moucheti]